MAIKNRRRAGAFVLLVAAALAGSILLCPGAVKAGSETDEAAAARHEYTEKIAAKYNYRFGKELPFVPSLAKTDTGEFIDPKNFPTAEYCGHCHQEAHKQWRESAHSNANRVPYYLKNVALLNDSKGVEFSRPISDERWGLITAIKMPDGGELSLYEPKHPVPSPPPNRQR